MVCNRLVRLQILHVHIVSALLLIPVRANDLMSRLNILVQPILARKIIKIRENLLGSGIHCRPIELRFKGPSVVVSGDITGAPTVLDISLGSQFKFSVARAPINRAKSRGEM